MYSKTFILATLFLCLNLFASAQVLSVSNHFGDEKSSLFASKLMLVIEEDAMEWSFFADSDARQVYIDFETMEAHAKSVKIMNGDKVLFKDNVSSLPHNTFYELDMRKMKPGFYSILVETETGLVEKEVILE